MRDSLAYHTVVHALEAKKGWTAERRFASAVRHSFQGHLPYARYHAAGRERSREGIGEAGVSRLVRDFLETDINPAVAVLSSLRRPANVIAGYNAYNAAANLGVRTNIGPRQPFSAGKDPISASRALLSHSDDPAPCRIATLSVLGLTLNHVESGGALLHRTLSLSMLAAFLGMGHGAVADVSRAIEDDWLAPLSELPRKLGCQKRTLERRLKEAGLAAQDLRRADRIVRATAQLSTGKSITAIALDSGYSDTAHMSRAFRAACGMTPSMLAKIALDG